MSSTSTLTADPTTALYTEVQRFYARQMQLLDAGRAEAWALTFAEDGVFEADARPEPVRGRERIREAASQAAAQLAERGVQVRHWIGMLDVQPQNDGSVRAVSYALVFNTPAGGETRVQFSTTCEDVLGRGEGGDWVVRSRRVARDDLR